MHVKNGARNVGTHKIVIIFVITNEKEMATHSSILAWRIPGTREPGGLSSMGSHRVGHDWSDLAAAAAAAIREGKPIGDLATQLLNDWLF